MVAACPGPSPRNPSPPHRCPPPTTRDTHPGDRTGCFCSVCKVLGPFGGANTCSRFIKVTVLPRVPSIHQIAEPSRNILTKIADLNLSSRRHLDLGMAFEPQRWRRKHPDNDTTVACPEANSHTHTLRFGCGWERGQPLFCDPSPLPFRCSLHQRGGGACRRAHEVEVCERYLRAAGDDPAVPYLAVEPPTPMGARAMDGGRSVGRDSGGPRPPPSPTDTHTHPPATGDRWSLASQPPWGVACEGRIKHQRNTTK